MNDTIAALATPVGTSALAVIRVSGPDTARLGREIFGSAPLPRRSRHGDYRARSGALVDEVLWVYFQAPHSYTAEDTLEITCHGNPLIAHRIVEDLLGRGCRAAEPGEFTQRAFLNGRMDLSQAEAVMDLIQARSERALAAANQQLRGSLGRRVQGAVDRLLGVLAQLEAYIDFPDEDLPAEDRSHVRAELERLQAETAQLLATERYGEILRDGIRTVIIGSPNVGKSSLLNRLVGRDRALVSAEPGTTRDFIEERIAVGPHCLRLIDTAGLNPTPAPLEKLGIEKTLERAADADLFMLVYDVTLPVAALPAAVQPLVHARNAILVLNKADLPHPPVRPSGPDEIPAVEVSALTGAGFERLTQLIVAQADAFSPSIGDEIVAISARHGQALGEVLKCLGAAGEKLATGAPIELTASDLRGALDGFGEISGRIDNEQMLDRLFAKFCIGK